MQRIANTSSSPVSSPKTALLVTLIFLVSGISLAIGGIYHYSGPSAPGRTSIGISESFNKCSIEAHYDPRNTTKVQAYIQQQLKSYVDLSVDRGCIDAHIRSGNSISFRIRSRPGDLYMILYRERSVPEAHVLWRQMGERLKTLIL